MAQEPSNYQEPPNYQEFLKTLTWLEKLGDSFTGLDNRLDYLNRLLSTVIVPAIVKPEDKKYIPLIPYRKLDLDISQERDNMEFPYTGNLIYVKNPQNITGAVTIKMEDATNDELDLLTVRRIRGPFTKFYISNTAGTGILEIVIGGHYAFEIFPLEAYNIPEAAVEYVLNTYNIYSGNSNSDQTLFSRTIPNGKVGILDSIELDTDNYDIAQFTIIVKDVTILNGEKIPTSFTKEFPSLHLEAKKSISVKVRSDGATTIKAWCDLSYKEVG